MITEDFALIKEIFSIIDNGIIDGYDHFRYEVVVGKEFIDTELLVEKDGVETTNARTDIDDTQLYELVDKLKHSAEQRGEDWVSFVISYKHGEQVSTKFKYPDN
ncbi:hypothetical protein [Pseudomonas sp. MH9.3]|uniref:hypothetical protein n=1 Tax=Pseudomonas sp. MH9.3 TaxID=3048630 RepID=UPI002AC99E08|nr:hypothetical protein [Pseudomonas sp. MH9.3]MEB0109259.1 hypothetical protein [Pseudomonas sp. MH9.3]WPX81643.1 hypothetical protein RHM60_11205 [Pseudomonas sp. MH9.3]WQG56801.1 hypothetical protein RHM66_15495 [Pseudomonas sp. RTB3]